MFVDCGQMQGKTIERQYPRLPHQYWSSTKGVLARGIRFMIQVVGIRIVVVRVRGSGV